MQDFNKLRHLYAATNKTSEFNKKKKKKKDERV